MAWYLKVLKDYAVFTGRARRTEYWMFTLINFIICMVLFAIEAVIGTLGIITMLYGLAVLIPGLAVSIRRLHDTDRSGWWLLVGFIPVVGGLILLVLMVLDSTPGENRFGHNPKGM